MYALLKYILGFVALEVPSTDTDTDAESGDELVRRLRSYFRALPRGEFPHHVELAPLLASISTDEQFQFGIRTLLAGLRANRDADDDSDGNPLTDGHRAANKGRP